MNKLLIALLLILSVALFACQQQKETTVVQTTTAQISEANQDANSAGFVKIQNFAYDSEVINIKKGESVLWKNYDNVPHDVVFSDFKSPLLKKDQTFTQQFNVAGTYEYYCSLHPSMNGRVVVE